MTMKTEIVNPNIRNFIQSLRDIGYSFEIAVADLIDNSITAQALVLKIHAVVNPDTSFSVLDNGIGMSEKELVEAMRLATRNPKEKRARTDLGRFGLGLKTSSFSQCRKLTVISKQKGRIAARQWDLDHISTKNAWELITPLSPEKFHYFTELSKLDTGTIVCWELIDKIDNRSFPFAIEKLRRHLSLVFHKFLEGFEKQKAIRIFINNNPLTPFNPFNMRHPATQQLPEEKIKIYGSTVTVQPYILPHHSKVSQQEYEQYSTEDGYIKSQGFYLYRGNRILVYGTWWGMHKSLDAHKLVRIKVDIPNDTDQYWGIDIKKSTANPSEALKENLKRIIAEITEKGSRPFTGRGRKIEDKSVIQFWQIVPLNDDFHFSINQDHPLYKLAKTNMSGEAVEKLKLYMNGLQAYLPLEAIQFHLQKHPHQIKQKAALTEDDLTRLNQLLTSSGLPQEYINDLLKTEIYQNHPKTSQNANE